MNPFADFGITFAWPWLLLGLLLIPLLSILKGYYGGSATVVFSSTQRLRSLGDQVVSRAGNFLTSLLYLALALLIVGVARPQKGKTMSTVEASGIDIMLVLDVSRSMLAEDFSIGGERTNRLTVVKQVTEKFIESRPNDRIGITAFAGRPYLVSPLTLDHDWLLKNMERVEIGLVEDGTAIGSAIASGANRLRGEHSATSRIMIVLTDGDNNAGRIAPATAAEAARALGIKIYTIGAGTEAPAPFPVGKDLFGRTSYRMVSFPLDVASLKQIAEIGQGVFYRATDAKSLEGIYEEIDRLEKTTFEVKKYSQYKDLFPWFVGAGGGLLLLQMVLSLTLWRKLP
ncbi:MAG TPA: VWA domain-containing protein [Chthoniobacteraceae bacterium]|nr:VWA domain-containing protein [Chthoniobacteraceae bacterium]